MASRLGIFLVGASILIAGVVCVWLYYGENRNQLVYAIAFAVWLIGIAYARYILAGGNKP
jgi:hypothetical protein